MTRDDLVSWLWWPFTAKPRHVLAWIVSVSYAMWLFQGALRSTGYHSCDFTGQWLLGRQICDRTPEEMYFASGTEKALAKGFSGKDLEKMVIDILWKGRGHMPEDDIEGPLYPPTAALLFSTFGSFEPKVAFGVVVFFYMQLVFLNGFLISQLLANRLQWGEINLILFFFPNNYMGLLLGQNQMLTLTILTMGWFVLSKGKPFSAGLVWSLLAFKPVFALPIGIISLLLPSARVPMGMACGGIVFFLSTFFVVNLDTWYRWFQVGQKAEKLYRVDRNWIWMSRDVTGLPRRKMWDAESIQHQLHYNLGKWSPGGRLYKQTEEGEQFSPAFWLTVHDFFDQDLHQHAYITEQEDGTLVPLPEADTWSWIMLGSVAGFTLFIGLLTLSSTLKETWDQRCRSPRSAFLLTGALLSSLHFMHYDLVLFTIPIFILYSHFLPFPGKFWGTLLVLWAIPWVCCEYSYMFADGVIRIPWETFLLLAFWLSLGIGILVEPLITKRTLEE